MNVRELYFDGDGWDIKVGQVYSNPWEENHFLVTRIEVDNLEMDSGVRDDAKIFYKEVDAHDYDRIDELEMWHRAWYVNDGNWDLERDVASGASK